MMNLLAIDFKTSTFHRSISNSCKFYSRWMFESELSLLNENTEFYQYGASENLRVE